VTRKPEADARLDVVGELLSAKAGYRLDPVVRDRLLRTVADAAKGRKQSVDDYVDDLRTDAGALQSLLDSITVQETWFFREPAHFDALVNDVLPGQLGPITIWSAGCANGQEAWSIAMAARGGADRLPGAGHRRLRPRPGQGRGGPLQRS
jgi:chemotaxis protein methyltransferase CheR